jgi:uncharacterized membrane protein
MRLGSALMVGNMLVAGLPVLLVVDFVSVAAVALHLQLRHSFHRTYLQG